MVKITKVYTRTGDQGKTSLAGGVRVEKCDERIEAIGSVDGLNSALGVIVAYSSESTENFGDLISYLENIQNTLFDLGASLSCEGGKLAYLRSEAIETLEGKIDEMNSSLPMLHSFILPGGCKISALMHIARTECRKAERRLTRLSQAETVEALAIPYLNRLSDWLFVAARSVNHRLGIDEPLWKPTKPFKVSTL